MVNNLGELTVLIDGVKTTFLKYPFRILEDFVDADGIKLLSIPELAATKAYTIGRRRELKDYVDLYFALKGVYVSLPKIIEIAGYKYQDEFNARLFLEQLVTTADVPEMDITFLKSRPSRHDMQSFFDSEVENIVL